MMNQIKTGFETGSADAGTASVSEHCFDFEADFVTSLRCIPIGVRLKLDTCGVKLKLAHWHQFSQGERQQFTTQPCTTPAEVAAYRDQLQTLVTQKSGAPAKTLAIDPQPPWLEPQIPDTVTQQANRHEVALTSQQWLALTPLQRFALIKLSRPGHENRNFLPALAEFGLLPT